MKTIYGENMKKEKNTKVIISPYIYIMLSFLGVIILGSILLYLPISLQDGVTLPYIDSLFLSTSATCVTGLSTVANINETFTYFGKIVLIFLMEIGGLSIVTIASFLLVLFGKKMGFSSKFFLTNALNQNSQKGIIAFLKKVVFMSLIIQGLFLIFNTIILSKYYDNFISLFGVAIFHTVSSFNNAGFDIFGSSSMINYSTDIWLNITTMLEIVLGGLGFLVLGEIILLPFQKRLSFHSKVVLLFTLVLILIPMVIFRFTMNITWLEALFTSVTARTAGFTTIDLATKMNETAAYPIMLILMFIGASPGSTGGGVKTTTFFTIIITIIYACIGKKPKAFKRNIAQESITKSFALIMISLAYVLTLIVLLKIFEKAIPFTSLMFEAFSAFGTVGVSMGITQSLTIASKILIIITMFVGRIGPLSFVSFWSHSFMEEKSANVRYVEEKITIG